MSIKDGIIGAMIVGGGENGGGPGPSAGVSSFNGRTGAVRPQEGDYTAAQVGARASTWMPTAGNGLQNSGDTMSVNVSTEADNATGILNGALYTSIPRPSAVYPLVEVTTVPATASVQVTATKGELSVQGTTDENGKVDIELSAFGVWTFTATIGGEQATADVAVNASQLYTLPLSPYSVFGVAWDKTNPSTQLTRLTPESDPNGLVTVAVTTEPQPAVGTGNGYSPFDQYLPWSGMEEYNIIDGAVSYKKGQPGFSRTEYDTMVYIPGFYYRVADTENIRYFYIASNQVPGFDIHPGSGVYVARYLPGADCVSKSGLAPVSASRPNARSMATSKGAGWRILDYKSLCAIQLLYIVEYADWNTQEVIGTGGPASQISGETDSMLYVTGSSESNAVQYRGIEALWHNLWQNIDGIITSDYIPYISISPAEYGDALNDTYISTGISVSNLSMGYTSQTQVSQQFPWAYIPTETSGSSTTFIPDKAQNNTGVRGLCIGGVANEGDFSGLFEWSAYDSPTASISSVSYRLLFENPNT